MEGFKNALLAHTMNLLKHQEMGTMDSVELLYMECGAFPDKPLETERYPWVT